MKKANKKGLFTFLFLLLCTACLSVASCGKDKQKQINYQFNTNGGGAVEGVVLDKGEEYTLPVPPEREGYRFLGWYTTEDFSGEPVEKLTADASLTFYAKWEKLYAVTLELDGGALENETALYLGEGEVIYDSVEAIVPVKEGFLFEAWHMGGAELSETAKMPAADVTLTAYYKVGYTIEIYRQKLDDLTEYEKADTIREYGYVNEPCTVTREIAGFEHVITSDSVVELKALSSNPSKNVFKLYFDRKDIVVSFDIGYPDGTASQKKILSVKYGQEVEVLSDYQAEGYCLIGWTTETGGDVLYKTNNIESKLHGGEPVSPEKFVPEESVSLVGVWSKGYTDMFGGSDSIYVQDGTDSVVYLLRGGVFFSGIYDSAKGTFTFRVSSDLLVRGKLNEEDGSFCYYDKDRADYAAILYQVGTGLVSGTTIRLKEDNGIVYNSDNVDSNGSYLIDENGYYVATFTDGDLAGKTLTFWLTTVTLNQSSQNAFLVRDEEEFATGTLGRFVLSSGTLVDYTAYIDRLYGVSGVYGLTLDGFGLASLNNGSKNSTYFYTKEENTVTLMNSSGSEVGVVRIIEQNGSKGYMFYDETLDRTVNGKSGDTLTLDGMCNATYKSGLSEISGYYTTKASLLGGTIVSFVSNGSTRLFLITTAQETTEEGDVTVYSFEEKPADYCEYYYKDAAGTYYAPLLVLNYEKGKEGRLLVYGYTSSKTYEKVSEGRFAYIEEADWYVYTAEDYFGANVLTSPVDPTKVSAFVFALDSTTTSYAVNYWYSMTSEGETSDLYEVYTSEEDDATKLTVVGGFAILVSGDSKAIGTYSLKENLLTLTLSAGKLYLEMNEENKTFVILKDYYSAYVIENGLIKKTEIISFDGKGGATYFVQTEEKDEEGNQIVKEYTGTVIDLEQTVSDDVPAYRFVSDDTEALASFDFVRLTDSSYYYVSKFSQKYNGAYRSEEGTLVLDGYGYRATFMAGSNSLEGSYSVPEENVVSMVLSDGTYRYFDLTSGRSFTLRGTEFGAYFLSDNQSIDGTYLQLDGYGNLAVYVLGENEDGEVDLLPVDEGGTYGRDGDVFTLIYHNGNEEIKLIGKFSTYTSGSNTYRTFVVNHKEISRTYVNEADWSVLIFDAYGNVTKYGAAGEKETGSYLLITDNLLYYVNEDGSDACIYSYDSEAGILRQKKYVERGYFTKDLESLLFSKYGFAIFNGTTRYYYDIDEDQHVLIYRQDAKSDYRNKYGFVMEDLGPVTAQNIVRDGKTYYNHEGFDIVFRRSEGNAEKFPLIFPTQVYKWQSLTFKPTGDGEFVSSGQIVFEGGANSISCSVVRAVDEEGNVEMYVLVPYGAGYYRFDVTVNFDGENNTYEITGMTYFIQSLPYTYMYYYYLYYSYFGVQIPNNIGIIYIERTYNEEGEIVSDYFNGTFGEGSGMYDSTGTIVKAENLSYTSTSSTSYSVEFTAEDGFVYRMYVGLKYLSVFGSYGYTMTFNRVETLTTDDGYTVEVERVIVSDSSEAGAFADMSLTKGEESLVWEQCYKIDGVWYYIVRTKDTMTGKFTETKYYRLTFVEKDAGGEVEEGEIEILPLFESVTVVEESIAVKYTQDDRSYADIREDNSILIFSVHGKTYIVKECTYDAETATYTVLTSAGTSFTIKDFGSYIEVEEAENTEAAA